MYLLFLILLSCQNLALTLPTMQRNCQQFRQRYRGMRNRLQRSGKLRLNSTPQDFFHCQTCSLQSHLNLTQVIQAIT